MLTHLQSSPVSFIWGQFCKSYLSYESLELAWKLLWIVKFHSNLPGANDLRYHQKSAVSLRHGQVITSHGTIGFTHPCEVKTWESNYTQHPKKYHVVWLLIHGITSQTLPVKETHVHVSPSPEPVSADLLPIRHWVLWNLQPIHILCKNLLGSKSIISSKDT